MRYGCGLSSTQEVPDPILGTQGPQNGYYNGARALFAATLCEALDCYYGFPLLEAKGETPQLRDERRKQEKMNLWMESHEWIFSEERLPMSFLDICDHLGYDAEYLRYWISHPRTQKVWRLHRYTRRGRMKIVERYEKPA